MTNQINDSPGPAGGAGMEPTAAELVKRGWEFFANKDYNQAIDDYQAALKVDPDAVDTHYALAMALKYSGKVPEAVQEFERVIQLASALEDTTRGMMVVRLSRGHINQMEKGDWDLSEDLWQKR